MFFKNRKEAAYLLVKKLEAYSNSHPLILAIPRGAVPMGRILADELDGDLDVVLVRKIGAPHNPEFALGAIDEEGIMYKNDLSERFSSIEYWERESSRQREILRQRRALYTPQRKSLVF